MRAVLDIGGLLGLHGVDHHAMQRGELGQVLLVGRVPVRLGLDALGHEVLGDDVLDLVGVLFLVADPAHDLVVVER